MYASYYALMAQRYLYENRVPRETLAKITVKNHRYACSSPFAQNPMKLTEQEVEREFTAAGFRKLKQVDVLPYQYFLIFGR